MKARYKDFRALKTAFEKEARSIIKELKNTGCYCDTIEEFDSYSDRLVRDIYYMYHTTRKTYVLTNGEMEQLSAIVRRTMRERKELVKQFEEVLNKISDDVSRYKSEKIYTLFK